MSFYTDNSIENYLILILRIIIFIPDLKCKSISILAVKNREDFLFSLSFIYSFLYYLNAFVKIIL